MKRIVICLAFAVLACAYGYAQTRQQDNSSPPDDITVLKRQRIELLQQRVSQIESFAKAGLVDNEEIIRPRMDIINARLDYAQSNEEKRELLTELIGQYDKLIEIAEVVLHAPALPPKAGQRAKTSVNNSSDLLFLKSERIRVQISRDVLN